MPKISLARLAGGLLIVSIPSAGELALGNQGYSGTVGVHQAVQGCSDILGAAPVVPVADEPPPRLVADAPIPSQLAEGRVVIRYCVHNLRILPVFGEAALGVSPRLGHLHITVDEGPYRWLDTSGQPVIVNKLPPGPHKILIELVDPTHKTLDRQVVSFTIPTPPFAPPAY
jgi:hypothetical protein